MSRLIERIDTELLTVKTAREQAVLLAQKGCYFSRIGRFDDAGQIIIYLRNTYGKGQDVTVSIWIMLLEGILHLYSNINPASYDRIRRAQFLSIAIGDRHLIAITSAWKAHLEFENSNFDAMIESLRLSKKNADLENHEAQSRLSMVLCDVMYLCGDRDRAQFWFMRSRSHALDAGDQATIEALLYNRSAFGMAYVRAQACIGTVDPNEITSIRHEMASARNFQDMTGIAAFSHLIGLCEARLCILENSFLEAIARLQASRVAGPFASYNFDQKFIDLELAFCYTRLDRLSDATSLVNTSEYSNFELLDLDEQLVASWLKYQLSEMNSYFGNPDVQLEQLNILRTSYKLHSPNN